MFGMNIRYKEVNIEIHVYNTVSYAFFIKLCPKHIEYEGTDIHV